MLDEYGIPYLLEEQIHSTNEMSDKTKCGNTWSISVFYAADKNIYKSDVYVGLKDSSNYEEFPIVGNFQLSADSQFQYMTYDEYKNNVGWKMLNIKDGQSFINYFEGSGVYYIREMSIDGVSVFAMYLLPAAIIMLTARKFLKIPDELYRKSLHFILLGAYFPFLFAFRTWWISAGFAAGLIIIIYPILAFAGKIPAFSSFVNERKKGEFKSSMVLALMTVIFSITICWGIFGDKLLTLACVYAWGVGDAFAALVGRQFGKHKIRLPLADPRKSWEGSAAMFLSAVVSVLIVLLVRGGLGLGACLMIALLAALATTYVELITKDGLDTITCPAIAMVVIIPLIKILGG